MAISVQDWVAYHARGRGGHLALEDRASERRISYADFQSRVGSLAAHLHRLGVRPGDRVAYLAANSTDILEMIFASWRVGAISLALNWRLTSPELDFILRDAGPTVIFHDIEFEAVVADLRDIYPDTHWISGDGAGGDTAYEAMTTCRDLIEDRIAEQDMEQQCLLMYSSGTTGRPKGVIITHGMMYFSAMQGLGFAGVSPQTVNYAVMPLFHIGGLNVFSCPTVYAGGTNIVERSFDAASAIDVISSAQRGVSHFSAVPAMYNAMKAHPGVDSADFSRLQAALAGAEPVPRELLQWWHGCGLKIQEGYGMTETVAASCLLSRDDVPEKSGSTGRPLMHCQARIMRNVETPALPGEAGELWMRGPVVTPGYWNMPEANETSFVDGWFRSGDVARMDEDGFVYIEDRLKDMYISGGENVYPAEVENVIYSIDGVVEAAVIGVPDEKWGETGLAVVAPAHGANLTAESVIDACAAALAKYKCPQQVVFIDALPRNATGKIQKPELRAQYAPTGLLTEVETEQCT